MNGPFLSSSAESGYADHRAEFFYRSRTLIQCLLLFRCELDLDILLQPLGPELARNANIQPADSILALQISSTGKNLLLVLENSFDHLCGRRRWGIEGRPRLKVLNNLSAAIGGALFQRLKLRRLNKLGNGDTSHGGVARERHHRVAVSAKHKGSYVLNRDIELFSDEGAETRGVQHTSHSNHALARQSRLLEGRLRHCIERVGDDNKDSVGTGRNSLPHHIAHNAKIRVKQIIAAHARLARNACGNHNDVRVGRVCEVIGTQNRDTALLHRHRLKQIEHFALRDALDDINQYNIREFLGRNPVGRCCTDVAGAYDGYFLT